MVFPTVLVGLGLQGIDGLTAASVEYQPSTVPSPVLSPTTCLRIYSQLLARRHNLALVDESIADGKVALPPVSDFYVQVQKLLPLAHTSITHASPIVFPKVLVGLGLQGVDCFQTEATLVEYQSPAVPSPVLSPTTGLRIYSQLLARRRNLALVNESITAGEFALPHVSNFYVQDQKSHNFKTIGLDAFQLERQSALYNLEHSDLALDHIFSHSPPIRLEKRTEMERQLLANLFKKNSLHCSKSQQTRSVSYPSCTQTNMEPPHPMEQSAISDERSIYSRSYQELKRLGSERLTIFRPRPVQDDLDLMLPTVSPQDDPRSPDLYVFS